MTSRVEPEGGAAPSSEPSHPASGEALLHQVAVEYHEMPGLRLHLVQAQRLFGLRQDICARVLDALVVEGVIHNGSVFPRARLRQILEGRGVPVHGNTEMPVWGWAFMRDRGVDGKGVEARIEALVSHLESLQKRSGD